MTLTLEFPPELESQLKTAARARGTDAGAFVVEATRAAIESTANGTAPDAQARNATPEAPALGNLSPMENAVAYIKANPIRSLGPVDAAADLEEVRAGRMEELGA